MASLDEIKAFAQNPNSIPSGGTYGEGRVYNIRQYLDTLKSAVQKGDLSLTDYQGLAPSLVKTAQATAIAAGGRGGSGGVWQSIVDSGFGDASGNAGMPFSRQEYAKLPDSVLPTQNDINSGMFDPTKAPLQRIQAPASNPTQPNQPQVLPPTGQPGTTPGATTPTNQTGTSPIYTANPNNPPPYGGLESNNQQANIDAQKIAQEAALQQQLSVQNQQGLTSQRQGYLNDLSNLLVEQQKQQLNAQAPAIYEDLNSRGLLRSSALGNSMATTLGNLQAQTTNQLAQQGIQGNISDLNNYKDIQSTYNQARNSALQRQFSVEDYNRQIEAGKQLGQQYSQLTPNQGKAGNPGAAIGTVAGGIGGAFLGGAPGAAAGASIGGSAGGLASKSR